MGLAKLFLTLATTVTAGGDAQLLCFGAQWCQPCQEMQPILQRLSAEGFPIRKMDVDQQAKWAKHYEVKTVPSFVLIDGQGRKIDQLSQATDYQTLRQFFAHYRISPGRLTVRGQSPDQVGAGNAGVQAPNLSAQVPAGDGGLRPTSVANADTAYAQVVDLSEIQAKCMAATVRLRVEDGNGHSFGTGTVVDLHGQEALVLTCGHIFRDSEGKGRILMERFDSPAAEPSTGTLISYNMDRDVALVSMKLSRPIAVAPLAPLRGQVRPGDPVFSIGCNQGNDPTIMEGQVNQVDKYLGPPNITASGRPVLGRSGGGLFNANGQLIGVCSAADPEIDEGLYGALPRVYYELDRNGLTFVYQDQSTNQSARATQPIVQVAATQEIPNPTGSNYPTKNSPPESSFSLAGNSTTKRGQELVCVLKGDENSSSQVFVIENPSDVLLEQLQRESKAASP